MAGHSHWAGIKHKKGRADKQRSKIFAKLSKEITVAAREGGGDADSNPRLRLALDKAFSGNMNKETVEKAINRGTGNLEGVSYEELTYEGYSSAGVAIIVECVTDNKNRTVAEVRHVFSRFSGNLGSSGSVSYLFKKIGVLESKKVWELYLEQTGLGDKVTVIASPFNSPVQATYAIMDGDVPAFIPKPGLLSISCSPGYINIVVLSIKSLFFPRTYENLADSSKALWIVLNGCASELP